MKNTIYKLTFLLSIFAVAFSCSSPEGETNYTAADYEFPSTVNLELSNVTNGSFNLTYSNSGQGEGYFVVVEGGSAAPSNEDVFAATADGMVGSGSFDLSGEAVNVIIDENLCDDSAYDVYAVQFTADSFLSETTASTTLTTISNNLAGTYETVSNGTLGGNFDGDTVTDFTGTVTIVDNGDGTFSFDDATAGFYGDPAYYGSFDHPPIPHTFEVPCNTIEDTFDTLFANCCGDAVNFVGIINADETISVHWENGFGEVMDVIYTKQ